MTVPKKKYPQGAPPMFKEPEEMQKKIDDYFTLCEGYPMVDENGQQVFDKFGKPIWLNNKPPTITGLALALGFTSRQALLNYQAKDAFVDTVTRAKARVEEYAETRLFDKDGNAGAKFSLANNFKGWSEKQEVKNEITGKDGGAVQSEALVQIYIPDNGR